jgi:hypothetical protein
MTRSRLPWRPGADPQGEGAGAARGPIEAPVEVEVERETPRAAEADDLPIVARLVVEVRSDGTRTIARGAVEDPEGHRVAVEVHDTTPWALAKQLAGALWRVPRLPRPSLRALLPGRRRR